MTVLNNDNECVTKDESVVNSGSKCVAKMTVLNSANECVEKVESVNSGSKVRF